MLIAIDGQPQMSFEQFQETFGKVFGRELTPQERRLLEPAFLKPELNTTFRGDAA